MPSRTATEERIRIEVLLDDADRRAALHDATFWSLRRAPKELPAVWLYDEHGSRLFDEITRLPEYYPTRREREILTAHAPEIAGRTAARTLVELGSGNSDKTRLLLDALQAAGTLERFVPLDVSYETLRASANAIANEYPTVGVHAIVGDFERHLAAIPDGERCLIAFLGSTIGNVDPVRRGRLFAAVASKLGQGDGFLLGVDLVKDPAMIEAACGRRAASLRDQHEVPTGTTRARARCGRPAARCLVGRRRRRVRGAARKDLTPIPEGRICRKFHTRQRG